MTAMTKRHPSGAAPGTIVPASTLITAVPGLIGFIPQRSLVILALDSDITVNASMRHDIPRTADGDTLPVLRDIVTHLGAVTARYGARAMLAVIIDDRIPIDDERHRETMALIDDAFAGVGGLVAGFVIDEIAVNRPWTTVWWPQDGRVRAPQRGPRRKRLVPVRIPLSGRGLAGDPLTSATAVSIAVRNGRHVLKTRSEIERALDPVTCDCDVCAAQGDEVIRGHREPDRAAALAMIMEVVTAMDSATPGDAPLDCASAVRIGQIICDLYIRDALLALGVTDLRHTAERLWSDLARRLTGSPGASAATLLGHLHYVAGEGAYAGVAFDRALTHDPDWSFAKLLDQALRQGARPGTLWEILDYSFDVAADLGVTFPARTLRRVG